MDLTDFGAKTTFFCESHVMLSKDKNNNCKYCYPKTPEIKAAAEKQTFSAADNNSFLTIFQHMDSQM